MRSSGNARDGVQSQGEQHVFLNTQNRLQSSNGYHLCYVQDVTLCVLTNDGQGTHKAEAI